MLAVIQVEEHRKNCISARSNSKIGIENWGQNTEGRSTLRVFPWIPRCWRVNIFVGRPMIYEGLWCVYVVSYTRVFNMESVQHRAPWKIRREFEGNIIHNDSLSCSASFVWELGSNYYFTIWPSNPCSSPGVEPSLTHSRKNMTNISSQPLKANAVFGLWGNFHIFSFLGFWVVWFRPTFHSTGRSGGATAGGRNRMQLDAIGKLEVSIWLFIKDTVKCWKIRVMMMIPF